jgi:hypothetical protein
MWISSWSTLPAELSLADLFTDWLSGEFDNNYQFQEDRYKRLPESELHSRLHSIFAPVEIPGLGSALYVKQYARNNPDMVYREKIYTVEQVGEEIVLHIYTPAEGQDIRDLHLIEGKAASVDVAQLEEMKGSEVYWTFDGTWFTGSVRGEAIFYSRQFQKQMKISGTIRLSKDELWLGETLSAVDGSFSTPPPGGVENKLWKARPVKLWGFVKTPDGYQAAQSLVTHDQGGSLELVDSNGNALGYKVVIEQLISFYGGNIPLQKLSVYRWPENKLVCYAFTDPDAERIGIQGEGFEVGSKVVAG